jgi:integrase
MAHIVKRGEQSWRFVVPMGYDADGKRRPPATKTIRVEDPALLRAPKRLEKYLNEELTKFKLEVEAGTHKKPGKKSFAAFIEEWQELHVAGLEYKTRQNYDFHCKTRIVPYFGSMYLDEIKTAHIVKFMADLKKPGKRLDGTEKPLKSATLVYVYRVLLSIFSKAHKWGHLSTNPMIGVDKPEENDIRKVEVYNEAELEQLFDALEMDVYLENRYKQPRYGFERMMFQVLVTLDLTTGMRRAELLGLKRSKINLETGICEVLDTIPAFDNGEPVIKRPKNNEPRHFALSPSIVEMLRDYFTQLEKKIRFLNGQENVVSLNEGDFDYYIFPNLKTGKPLAPSSIKKKWYAFHDRHPQLKYIPFHGIRHTATSIMIAKNVHAKAIAKRLGWKSTKMVDHYGKIFASVDEAAAAVFEDVLPVKNKKTNNG